MAANKDHVDTAKKHLGFKKKSVRKRFQRISDSSWYLIAEPKRIREAVKSNVGPKMIEIIPITQLQ